MHSNLSYLNKLKYHKIKSKLSEECKVKFQSEFIDLTIELMYPTFMPNTANATAQEMNERPYPQQRD